MQLTFFKFFDIKANTLVVHRDIQNKELRRTSNCITGHVAKTTGKGGVTCRAKCIVDEQTTKLIKTQEEGIMTLCIR